MKLTVEDQQAQDALERSREVLEASAKPRPKGGRPNRATRRSWGMRGTPPLGGAFRRPSTRPARGIDPTPVQRSSTRLHGRCRHDQERRAFDARKAFARTRVAFRGIGDAARGLTDTFRDASRALEGVSAAAHHYRAREG